MRMRLLALVLCLCTIFGLCGCAVSEEYRFVNPTESYSFEITEPPQTSPTEPEPTVAETAPPTLSAGAIASGLSDEDLVAQLFLVKCPVGGPVDLLEKHHIGGLVLFDSDVIDALRLLTHNDDTPYMDYVARIKPNPIARAVKLADLSHNSDMSRLDESMIDEWAQLRAQKYRDAIAFLLS